MRRWQRPQAMAHARASAPPRGRWAWPCPRPPQSVTTSPVSPQAGARALLLLHGELQPPQEGARLGPRANVWLKGPPNRPTACLAAQIACQGAGRPSAPARQSCAMSLRRFPRMGFPEGLRAHRAACLAALTAHRRATHRHTQVPTKLPRGRQLPPTRCKWPRGVPSSLQRRCPTSSRRLWAALSNRP